MTNIKYILISSLLVISAGCGNPQAVNPSASTSPSPTQSAVASAAPTTSSSASPTSSVKPTTTPTQSATPDGKKLAVSKIIAGTSYGMCVGYCQQQVTFNPTTLTVSKRANGGGEVERGTAADNSKYPPISKDLEFPQSEWNSLYTTVDTAKFQASEERIGCPDCADGGAEFIEITTPNYTKRITFEAGKTIEGMEKFVEQVRALRIKYLEQVK